MTKTAEVNRIAKLLATELDGGAAALLVAIWSGENVVVQRDDIGYLRDLEAAGCVSEGKVTIVGMRVAIVLRRKYGVVAVPRWP